MATGRSGKNLQLHFRKPETSEDLYLSIGKLRCAVHLFSRASLNYSHPFLFLLFHVDELPKSIKTKGVYK